MAVRPRDPVKFLQLLEDNTFMRWPSHKVVGPSNAADFSLQIDVFIQQFVDVFDLLCAGDYKYPNKRIPKCRSAAVPL